jgi:hypothetical protein
MIGLENPFLAAGYDERDQGRKQPHGSGEVEGAATSDLRRTR